MAHGELRIVTSKAAAWVAREDKRRRNLYQKFGKTDYDDPFLYHLVINMGRFSMERACRQVLQLVKD